MKKFKTLAAPILSTCILFSQNGLNDVTENYVQRDIQIAEKESIELDSLLVKFDDYSREYDYENNVLNVSVVDKVNLNEGNNIVNLSNHTILNDDISSIDLSILTYEFSYNAENCNMVVGITKTQNGISEYDCFEGYAFTTIEGEIDFRFIIGENIYCLSDLKSEKAIVETGWFSNLIKTAVQTVVSVVVAPVVTMFCPTVSLLANSIYAAIKVAETTHGAINYAINKHLSVTSTFPDGYIYGQGAMNLWRFGNRRLSENGCGIIATYNALKLVGSNPDLASIIYDFDYRSGSLCLGFFGSDPSHVSEYIRLKLRKVSAHYSFSSLENNLTDNKVAIICQINDKNDISYGAHYYVVHKKDGKFYTYNRYNSQSSAKEKDDFSYTYDSNARLVVGYIVS